MSASSVLVIANPSSQRGNGAAAAQVALSLLQGQFGKDGVRLELTNKPKHAIAIAHELGPEYDTVVALGGDGTVHEVVNGLMQLPREARPIFGLIPVGSGNDYARTLGISEKVERAVAQLIAATPRPIDVGCCNGEWFAETLSFGLDAAIALDTVERRTRTGHQGTRLYLESGLDQLLHHLDAYRFEATLDGARTLSGSIHMLAVQVGPTYGGGFRICPEANTADGILDICFADAPMSIPEATFKFLRAKDAKHVGLKKIHFERASSLHLVFDRRPPCQIDGEPHVADAYDISIERHALQALGTTAT